MSREGEFLIYCIEIFKTEKRLSGRETMRLFEKYRVCDYVKRYFEALHTTGEQYIVHDIDSFIKTASQAAARG